MAQDIANGISYYLLVQNIYKEDIAPLRTWTNLKVALDKNSIWITNFTLAQIESITVKSLPYKTVFYSKNGKLFLLHSLLPERNEPSFLWTPIERALPITINKFNHNYFGIKENIQIQLVSDETQKEASVMFTSITSLKNYVETAPKVRLKNLKWVLIDTSSVFIFGTPILPINGKVFWKNNNLIIPVGYHFELPILDNLINKITNPDHTHWIVWNKDNSCIKIDKTLLQPLTISSVRKTITHINSIENFSIHGN